MRIRVCAIALSFLLAACTDRGSVVFVKVESGSTVQGITQVHAAVTANGTRRDFDSALPPSTTTPFSIAIDLTPSISGSVQVHLDCLGTGGAPLGSGDGSVVIQIGAVTDLTITIGESNADGGMNTDLSSPDLEPPGPAVAARLVSPLSTATVTSRRPKLMWIPASGGALSNIQVDLCSSRACTSPIATATVDPSGASAVPDTDLPSGVAFWRVHTAVNGVDTLSGTWQFNVGRRTAGINTSFGTSLDYDGDGKADIVVGASTAAGSTGKAYAWSGALKTSFGGTGTPFTNGSDGGSFAQSLASAGDVDGDGYADVIVGAMNVTNGTSLGAAYIFWGSATGLGTTPTRIDNGADGGNFGSAVASAGDVDGDGYADVLVGAQYANNADGKAYLFWGGPRGSFGTNVTPLTNGSDGNYFGESVASAGDVDGDGFADVVVGTGLANVNGRAYIFWGGPRSGFGINPVVLSGTDANGNFGSAVAGATDIDGDGYSDILVGAWHANKTYVFWGGPRIGFGASSTPFSNGTDGGGFGQTLSGVGDVDGDGYGDVIVSASTAGTGQAGKAYVFFGGARSGFGTFPTTLTNGTDGGHFGHAATGAGDVDGDGFPDVVVGAYVVSKAYVFWGGSRSNLGANPASINNGSDLGSFGWSVARADRRAQTLEPL